MFGGAQFHVRALARIKAGHFDRLFVVAVALFEDHHLDAVDGVGHGVFGADDCRARLGPFYHIAVAGLFAVAVVGKHETVIVGLAAVVGVIHAAQAGDELVEREIGALRLVHVVGGNLPAVAHRIERKHAERGEHAHEDGREEHFHHGEGSSHCAGFLQKVT